MADGFEEVPGGSNNNNYANVRRIVELAEKCDADAVWAGWGHASENPALPNALARTKKQIVFIGPPAGPMHALGDKIGSTLIAQSAMVPTIAWNGDGLTVDYKKEGIPDAVFDRANVKTVEQAVEAGERVGFPLMIKASEGGGGKGIRKVASPEALPQAFRAVQGEVPGSPIFLMRLASHARHLEVQLLADSFGGAIALSGRDCSVQRRHQKIVEEGPPVAAPLSVWRQMELAAVRLAKEVGYVNAGTVEYLFMEDQAREYERKRLAGEDLEGVPLPFAFLELNPRLQVEHPVTEMITGVNLPASQLQVAMGIRLDMIPDVRRYYNAKEPFGSEPIDLDNTESSPPSGHVIAARITAENPDSGFQPTSGRVTEINFRSTPDVWGYFSVDSSGLVHEFADSQIGHLFGWGTTREEARRRMVVALKELSIRGDIRTTVEYLVSMMETGDFVGNKIDTEWLDRRIESKVRGGKPDPVLVSVVGAACQSFRAFQARKNDYVDCCERGQPPPSQLLAVDEAVDLIYEGVKYSFRCCRAGPHTVAVHCNGQLVEVRVRNLSDKGMLVQIGERSHLVYLWDEKTGLRLSVDGKTCVFDVEYDPSQLTSSVSGKVARFLLEDGAHVRAGQAYVEVEVMKMYLPLVAPESGTLRVCATEGAVIEPGDLLATMELDDPSRVSKADPFDGAIRSVLERPHPFQGPVPSSPGKQSTERDPAAGAAGRASGSSSGVSPAMQWSAVAGRKAHVVLREAMTTLTALMDGDDVPSEALGTALYDRDAACCNPHTPQLELEEALSTLSGRLPPAVDQALQRLLELHRDRVQEHIGHAVDAIDGKLTEAAVNAVSKAVHGLGSSAAATSDEQKKKQQSEEEATLMEISRRASGSHLRSPIELNMRAVHLVLEEAVKGLSTKEAAAFDLSVAPIRELVRRYWYGVHGRNRSQLCELLQRYLAVEQLFGRGSASSRREDEVVLNLRQAVADSSALPPLIQRFYGEGYGVIFEVARSHARVEQRNVLVIEVLKRLQEDSEKEKQLKNAPDTDVGSITGSGGQLALRATPPAPLAARPPSGADSQDRPHRGSGFVDELLGLTTGTTPDVLAMESHGQSDTGPLAIGAPLDAGEEDTTGGAASGMFGVSSTTASMLQDQMRRSSVTSPQEGGPSPVPGTPAGNSLPLPDGVEPLHAVSNSVLHSLAELHGASYAAVALEARSLLVVRQQPSVTQKLRAIEAALLGTRGSAQDPADAQSSASAAAALREALVQTEQPIEDVLMWFFGHEESKLRCSAVETYIRRLYRSYVVQGVSVRDKEGTGAAAPLQVTWQFFADPSVDADAAAAAAAATSGGNSHGSAFHPVDGEKGLPRAGALIPSFDSVDDLQRMQQAKKHEAVGAGLAYRGGQPRALAPVPEQSDITPGMRRHGLLAVFTDVAHVRASLQGVIQGLAGRTGGASASAVPGGPADAGEAVDEENENAVNVVHIAVLAPPSYEDLEVVREQGEGRARAGTEQSSVISASLLQRQQSGSSVVGPGGLTEAQTVELLTRISEHCRDDFAAAGVRRVTFMVDQLVHLQGTSQGTPTQDALMVTVQAVADEAQRFKDRQTKEQEEGSGASGSGAGGAEDDAATTPMGESVRIALPGSIVPLCPDPAVARARAVAGSEDSATIAAGEQPPGTPASAMPLARRSSVLTQEAGSAAATAPLDAREALLRLVFGRRSIVTAPGFPAVFTLRSRKKFREDSIVRHIEPPMSGFLELSRMENFRIRIIHTPNRSVHVYEAVAHRDEQRAKAALKAGKRAPRPRKRYFVRGIVRHTERLSSAESAASMFPGPERVFVEALNALAISIGERALEDTSNPVGNNHIFLNVVPVANITPDFVQVVIQKLARLYAKKLRHLRVSTVEFKITLRGQHGGPCTAVRIIASNPTGYVLRVDQYAEVSDPASGQGASRFRLIGSTRSGATRPGQGVPSPGQGAGAAGAAGDLLGLGAPGTGMLAAVGAVPSTSQSSPLARALPPGAASSSAGGVQGSPAVSTAEYENWDGKLTTAPYPDESVFESKRALAAAASETVYCWDFIELFQRALEVSWDRYQRSTRGSRDPHPRPRQLLQVTELALSPKKPVVPGALAGGGVPPRQSSSSIGRTDSYYSDVSSSEMGQGGSGGMPLAQQQQQRLLESDGLAHRRSFGAGGDHSSDTTSEPSENKGEWTSVGRRRHRSVDEAGSGGGSEAGTPDQPTQQQQQQQPAAPASFPPGATFEEQYDLVERDPLPGQNRIGMVAWRLRMYTPEYPERAGGREIVVIANDITVRAGSFGTKEDALFDLASKRARELGLPRIYMAANSGARIGLAEEVKRRFRVAWNDPTDPAKGFKYLYLTEADHAELAAKGSVRSRKVVDPSTGTVHHELLDIIGSEPDIGVENLRGSATIAGETSRAYKDVFTLTYVTGRSVGIGAYLVRLGQRTIQKAGAAPIILTGFHALNKLIGRRVYTSNQQLGGPRIMHTNGVSHLVVETDLQGVAAILRWLAYVPARAGGPLPDSGSSAALDPVDRDVQYRPPADGPFDPRHLLVGAAGTAA